MKPAPPLSTCWHTLVLVGNELAYALAELGRRGGFSCMPLFDSRRFKEAAVLEPTGLACDLSGGMRPACSS